MATPSLAMIPSAIADSKVYSVLPNNGDGDFTFNRDSSATRVGQNGLIQTVGYFGSELVTNGDFDGNATGWTLGAGVTYGSNNIVFTSSSSNTSSTIPSVVIGTTYLVIFSISNYTAGTIRSNISGTVNGSEHSGNGTKTDYITANATGGTIYITSTGFTGSIDNVSVKEVTGDQPRLNYDISNGVVQSCPSLLLEPASTNLITYSEAFDNAYWTKSGSSVASGFTSPSGDLSAFKFAEDGTNSYHYCRRLTVAVASASIVTLSLFAKKSENSYVALFEGRSGGTVFFNLETKTVVSASGGASGTIEQLPNDWCKIALTVTVPSTIANFEIYNSNDGTSLTYQGVSGNGVYIWGAQLEQLSYATSYIPTLSGASQTRAAESCFGAGTASTFNDSEGVLYAEISGFVDIDDYRMISLNAGGSANTLFLGIRNDTGNVYFYLVSGGVVQSNYISTVNSTNTNVKLAVKYKTNDVSFWVNGVELYTDASATMITGLNQLEFGYGNGEPGSYPFYGKCKDLRVYNEALTDAQLQTLTTL